MGALANKNHTLASNVANSATFTTTYPTGFAQADLIGSVGAVVADMSNQAVWKQGAGGFTLVFGSSDITFTNDSGVQWNAGSELILSFGDNTLKGSFNQATRVGGVVPLTVSVGTGSNTIADVGGSFVQATMNNIIRSLADKINQLQAAQSKSGETNG